jgi:SAM-dependent methyltransferase
MASGDLDKAFSGSIPQAYDTHLVPLIFEPYAADLVEQLQGLAPSRILETAAGTGVLTRALSAGLAATASIVATDLNLAMLHHGMAVGTRLPVQWQYADAMRLPFPDASFDAVVCQFGVMFFPVKAQAFKEARRVLRPGGVFLFNVWDRLVENEFAETVATAVATVFPGDPPGFLGRTPYGYYDLQLIQRDLAAGGFTGAPQIRRGVPARSRAASPEIPAVAFCQGTPLRNDIEVRDPARLGDATAAAAEAIAARFGRGPVDGKIQAHVIMVAR